MSHTICEAILLKRLISFSYEGTNRVVIPHCLGFTHKDKLAVRAYQVKGYSESGNVPLWKLYSVGKISNLEILDRSFQDPVGGYMRGDKGMSEILCEL